MSNPLERRPSTDGVFHLMPDTSAAVSLPMPAELAAVLRGHLENEVTEMRAALEARGGVVSKTDVFPVVRYLHGVDELLGEYARLLGVVRKDTIKPMVEEVVADAVGADDQGQPLSGLNVPDRDGDIRVTRKSRNVHHIAGSGVLPAFAAMFADQHTDAVLNNLVGAWSPEQRAAVGQAVAAAVLDALDNVGELGKFDLQVSKVRAYADALSRAGQDKAAGIVLDSINTTREYDGISVERKAAR